MRGPERGAQLPLALPALNARLCPGDRSRGYHAEAGGKRQLGGKVLDDPPLLTGLERLRRRHLLEVLGRRAPAQGWADRLSGHDRVPMAIDAHPEIARLQSLGLALDDHQRARDRNPNPRGELLALSRDRQAETVIVLALNTGAGRERCAQDDLCPRLGTGEVVLPVDIVDRAIGAGRQLRQPARHGQLAQPLERHQGLPVAEPAAVPDVRTAQGERRLRRRPPHPNAEQVVGKSHGVVRVCGQIVSRLGPAGDRDHDQDRPCHLPQPATAGDRLLHRQHLQAMVFCSATNHCLPRSRQKAAGRRSAAGHGSRTASGCPRSR